MEGISTTGTFDNFELHYTKGTADVQKCANHVPGEILTTYTLIFNQKQWQRFIQAMVFYNLTKT